MKKRVNDCNVYYTIMWSPVFPYDKYHATRILPELAGVICLMEKNSVGVPKCLLFYSCWRDGLRMGIKNLFDPIFSKIPDIREMLIGRNLLYKYTVIDTTPVDMKDIMYWLILSYRPEFNNYKGFKESGRYEKIYVRQMEMGNDDLIEKFPIYL